MKPLNLESLLGANGGAIAYTFNCMSVAEDLIKATFRGREPRDRPYSVFLALVPSDPLKDKSVELYRAHAVELCQRMKSGQPLDPATDAECLAVLSNTSLIAPLGRNAGAAMEALFAKCFPKSPHAAPHPTAFVGGSWPKAVDETIAEVRRKFAVKARGIPEEG